MAASPSFKVICVNGVVLLTVPCSRRSRKYQFPIDEAGRLSVVVLGERTDRLREVEVQAVARPTRDLATGPAGKTRRVSCLAVVERGGGYNPVGYGQLKLSLGTVGKGPALHGHNVVVGVAPAGVGDRR